MSFRRSTPIIVIIVVIFIVAAAGAIAITNGTSTSSVSSVSNGYGYQPIIVHSQTSSSSQSSPADFSWFTIVVSGILPIILVVSTLIKNIGKRNAKSR